MTLIRPIELSRAAWGVALLSRPRWVLTRVHRVRIDRPSLVIARILGARHLAQAALSGAAPTPAVLAMGVWVDGVHALTAVGLAVADRSRARAGLVDAGIALTWATFGRLDLDRPSRQGPADGGVRDRLARAVLGVLPGGDGLLRRIDGHPGGH